MKLISPTSAQNEQTPSCYVCDGVNTNSPLEIDEPELVGTYCRG